MFPEAILLFAVDTSTSSKRHAHPLVNPMLIRHIASTRGANPDMKCNSDYPGRQSSPKHSDSSPVFLSDQSLHTRRRSSLNIGILFKTTPTMFLTFQPALVSE